MEKIQDIDYLYASTRIKALERSLVTNERLKRMAEAKSDEELLKVLDECGYGEISSISQIPAAIAEKRSEVINDVLQLAPDKKVVQVFLLKYDYHNLKAIIKGQAANAEYESTLMETGNISIKQMLETTGSTVIGSDGRLSGIMKSAANEARDLLARTGDSRLADTVLDKACFAEMLKLAAEAGSNFLTDYIKLLIDSVNLRTAVRLRRMRQDSSMIAKYLIEGGNGTSVRLKTEITPESLVSAFESSPLKATAIVAADVLREGTSLAAVDTQAENALLDYLKNAKYIAFGEQHIAAYIAARETEFTALNMVMAGRKAEMSPGDVMERLRDTYV